MNHDELTIGDWVCAKMLTLKEQERLTPPMRVERFDTTYAYLLIDAEAGDPDEYHIADLRPVPLTREILRANRIGEHGSPDRYRFCEREKYGFATHELVVEFMEDKRIYVRIVASPCTVIQRYVSSVHELQHCLRLAGFDLDIIIYNNETE